MARGFLAHYELLIKRSLLLDPMEYTVEESMIRNTYEIAHYTEPGSQFTDVYSFGKRPEVN
jgi:hypothetical protein